MCSHSSHSCTNPKSLKADRSLPRQRPTLPSGKDLRSQAEQRALSRMASTKYISCHSLFTKTALLCYELCDQEALTPNQVKAHDVRSFAAFKASQSEISLEQLLSAGHWKSNYTFTKFYLNDVAWADSELLGHFWLPSRSTTRPHG